MLSAAASAVTSPRWAAADSFCAAGVLTLAAEIPSAIRQWMEQRDALADRAGQDVSAELSDLANLLASAVQDWLEEEGADAVRGRALAMSFDDVLGIMDAVGAEADAQGRGLLLRARDSWATERLHALADLALENTASAAGLEVTGFDANAWSAVQRGALRNAEATWDTKVRQAIGEAVFREARAATLLSPATVAERVRALVTEQARPSSSVVTEMITATAAYDRTVSAAIAADLDTDGDILVAAYSGPVDGLQRPFCAAASGHYFTRAQLARLNNGILGMPVIEFCGGWRCRHQLLWMTRAQAERAGLTAVDELGLQLINAVARASR